MWIGVGIGILIGMCIMTLILGLCSSAGKADMYTENLYFKCLLNEIVERTKNDEELQEYLLDKYIKEYV